MSITEDSALIRKMLAPALGLTGKRARSLRTGHVGVVTRMSVGTNYSGGIRHAFELTTDAGAEHDLQIDQIEFIDLPGMDKDAPPAAKPKQIDAGQE